MAITVEIGVNDARIAPWKMLEDELPCIRVAFLQRQQMIAGKPTHDFIDIALLLLSTQQDRVTAEKTGDQSYKHGA
jgi:hypothetical protein